MSRFILCCVALGAIFLSESTTMYAATPARTPDQLVKNLTEAAETGEVKDYLANLSAGSAQAIKESIANRAALFQTQQKLQQALDDRFGKGGKLLSPPPDSLKSATRHLISAEILSKKQTPGGGVEMLVITR